MIKGDPNPKINPEEFFPFDMRLFNLGCVDEELLLKAIEEKEKQKREFIASADETISRILKELKRRKCDKSLKDNNLEG